MKRKLTFFTCAMMACITCSAQITIFSGDGTPLITKYCHDNTNHEIKATPAGGVFYGDGVFDSLGKTYFNPVRAGIGITVYPFQSTIGYEFEEQKQEKKVVVFKPIVINPPLTDLYTCDGYFSFYATMLFAGAYTYTWEPPAYVDRPDTGVTAGYIRKTQKFKLVVVDVTNGCSGKDSSLVTLINMTKPEIYTISLDGQTLTTKETYKHYQWLFNGQEIPEATNAFLLAREVGSYQVVVRNEYDCIDTSENYSLETVSIDNAVATSKSLYIYPNPVIDLIHINSNTDVDVTITSIEGKLIKHYASQTTIPVSNLTKGIYLINLIDKQGNVLKVDRFVKL